MQAFNPGDPVYWPTHYGWQSGTVVRVEYIQFRTYDGATLDMVRLTIRDGVGAIIRRDIRNCAASIPGPHVIPAEAEAA